MSLQHNLKIGNYIMTFTRNCQNIKNAKVANSTYIFGWWKSTDHIPSSCIKDVTVSLNTSLRSQQQDVCTTSQKKIFHKQKHWEWWTIKPLFFLFCHLKLTIRGWKNLTKDPRLLFKIILLFKDWTRYFWRYYFWKLMLPFPLLSIVCCGTWFCTCGEYK